MRKLNYLLHNVTVINFLLMGKLVLRYRIATIVALCIAVILIPTLYFRQPVVFQKEVHFMVFSETGNSIMDKINPMANLINQSNSNTIQEILALVGTYEFKTTLSNKLVDSKEFEKLDLRHPTSNSNSLADSLPDCKDRSCRVVIIRDLVANLFSVHAEPIPNRFGLKITTRSEFTTMEFLRVFQEALDATRIANSSSLLTKQIAQLQDLLVKNKVDLESKGGIEKLGSSAFLDAQIEQQQEKIRTLTQRLIRDDNEHFFQSTRLKESNIAAGATIKGEEKLGFENYVKVSKRIEELRQNIAAINSMGDEGRSSSDQLVLKGLTDELTQLEQQQKSSGHFNRNIAVDDNFINQHKGNKSSYEFDAKITNAQVKKLRGEYDRAMRQLDELYARRASLENELIALKPDVEYLKLLEGKLVALKFKQGGLATDIAFENYGTEVRAFKRNGLAKIAAFTLVFMGFLLFIACLVMYLIDDRIFEELEVQRCIEELPIVGHAPYFE